MMAAAISFHISDSNNRATLGAVNSGCHRTSPIAQTVIITDWCNCNRHWSQQGHQPRVPRRADTGHHVRNDHRLLASVVVRDGHLLPRPESSSSSASPVISLRDNDHCANVDVSCKLSNNFLPADRGLSRSLCIVKPRRRGATACHHKTLEPAVSRQEHPARPANITEVWGAGVQCCWSRSLEQPSDRHSDHNQLLSLQKET